MKASPLTPTLSPEYRGEGAFGCGSAALGNPWFALLWLRWVALDSSASCLSHSALAIRQKKEHEHRSIDDGKRFEQQGTIRRHPVIGDQPRVAKFQ